jgi:hypothetical protein
MKILAGTSNEYSLSDEFVVNMVRKFGTTESNSVNPLRSERWSDLILSGEAEDVALTNAGYETALVTGGIPRQSTLVCSRS